MNDKDRDPIEKIHAQATALAANLKVAAGLVGYIVNFNINGERGELDKFEVKQTVEIPFPIARSN
jgi:hypothetical protein